MRRAYYSYWVLHLCNHYFSMREAFFLFNLPSSEQKLSLNEDNDLLKIQNHKLMHCQRPEQHFWSNQNQNQCNVALILSCTSRFIFTFCWVYLHSHMVAYSWVQNVDLANHVSSVFIHCFAWELRRIFCNVFLNLIVLQTRKSLQKRRFIPNTTASLPTHTFYGSKLRQNFKFWMVMLNKSPKIFRTISRADFKNSSASMLNFHIKQFVFSKTMLLEIRLQDLIHLAGSERNVLFFPHKM